MDFTPAQIYLHKHITHTQTHINIRTVFIKRYIFFASVSFFSQQFYVIFIYDVLWNKMKLIVVKYQVRVAKINEQTKPDQTSYNLSFNLCNVFTFKHMKPFNDTEDFLSARKMFNK